MIFKIISNFLGVNLFGLTLYTAFFDSLFAMLLLDIIMIRRSVVVEWFQWFEHLTWNSKVVVRSPTRHLCPLELRRGEGVFIKKERGTCQSKRAPIRLEKDYILVVKRGKIMRRGSRKKEGHLSKVKRETFQVIEKMRRTMSPKHPSPKNPSPPPPSFHRRGPRNDYDDDDNTSKLKKILWTNEQRTFLPKYFKRSYGNVQSIVYLNLVYDYIINHNKDITWNITWWIGN